MSMQAERSVEVNREHEPPDAEQLVADLSALVSPPRVCVKMFELVRSARASAHEIGEVVALDPNLAARLLRIVNSSFYGFPAQISTIARAVTVLGTRDLCNMVLAIAAVRSFSKAGAGLVRMEAFWQHSVFCALLARQLAHYYRIPDADRLFVAGLLHEVGICVIHSQLPQFEQPMQVALSAGEAALHDAEIEHIGYSHASIGALVLEQWQLPIELRDAVRHHHSPASAPTGRVEAALIHLADALASRADSGALSADPTTVSVIDDAAWEVLGTGPEYLDELQIIGEASEPFTETMRNLLPAKGR